MKRRPEYAELHCVSNFTFLRGAAHPQELVVHAHELGYAALAITDECSLAGVVRAHEAARDCGLKLIIGAEVRLEDGLKQPLRRVTRSIPMPNGICARYRGSLEFIRRNCSPKRCVSLSAAIFRSMSCVTSIPTRSCRRGIRRRAICAN